MLTIFTTPKPFTGHNGVIQTNAIRSWLALKPTPEILVLGNDEGVAEVCAKFGLRHLPKVECNEYGTPLVSSLFSLAQETASRDILCYVNADIILLSDFLPAIRQVKAQSYLIIGQRWDLDVNEPIDFASPDWEERLLERVRKEGRLHPVTGIDYFVFPRGLYSRIPPFAIGRTGWDNWLVYQARKSKAYLIDATSAITAIHQNHDYSHHPGEDTGVWKGQEAIRNTELMGGLDNGFTVEHADRVLSPEGLKPAMAPRRLYFRMRSIPILNPRLHFLLAFFKAFEKVFKAARAGT